jgi:hypothetical protein
MLRGPCETPLLSAGHVLPAQGIPKLVFCSNEAPLSLQGSGTVIALSFEHPLQTSSLRPLAPNDYYHGLFTSLLCA